MSFITAIFSALFLFFYFFLSSTSITSHPLPTSAPVNHRPSALVLWVPTTLGLCCAWFIVPPTAIRCSSRPWVIPTDLVSYDTFLSDMQDWFEFIEDRKTYRYPMTSRPSLSTHSPTQTESTIAVLGPVQRQSTTAPIAFDDNRTKPVYGAPAVAQAVSKADSTITALAHITSPIPLPDDAPADNESIISVLDSAMGMDHPATWSSARTIRSAHPSHEVIRGPEIPSSASSCLDQYFTTAVSMEFQEFLKSVAPEADMEPEYFTICPWEYKATKMPGYSQQDFGPCS